MANANVTANGTRMVSVMKKSELVNEYASNERIQALMAELALEQQAVNAAAQATLDAQATEFQGVVYTVPQMRAEFRSLIQANKTSSAALLKQVVAKKDFSLLDDYVDVHSEAAQTSLYLSIEDAEKWFHFQTFFTGIGHSMSRSALWVDAKPAE